MDLPDTGKTMSLGALAGIGLILPFISWQNGLGWNDSFLVSLVGNGFAALVTFFHEIGHTVAGWFYGYVTLPAFDFQHGGGMAWQITGQLLPLNLALYAGIGYLFHLARWNPGIRILLGLLALFHLATAYNDFHMVVIDFMGPAFEALTGGFLLFRAWMNLAARGWGERFLNAAIGWAMCLRVLVDSWGLTHNEAARTAYYTQKGTHGFGDFDKIADNLGLDFGTVVFFWGILAITAMVIPVLLYKSGMNE